MATDYLNLYEFLESEIVNVEDINQNSAKIDAEAYRQEVYITGLPTFGVVEDLIENLFKEVTYNGATGVLTFTRYDNTTKAIDLPLELLINDGSYDITTKELVLVLANMDEIRIPVEDLISEYTAEERSMKLTGTVFGLKDELYNKLANIENNANYYSLPTTSPTVLGGSKSMLATSEFTDSVGVDGAGFLWAKPSVKLVKLTQAEYDALVTKDENTIYCTKEEV